MTVNSEWDFPRLHIVKIYSHACSDVTHKHNKNVVNKHIMA